MNRPRVVVTGLGAVTPIGTGREVVWSGLLAGRSGFGPVDSFDTGRYTVHVGAEIRDFHARSRRARRPRLPVRDHRRA